MKVALDYDGTYTADPELWDDFIRIARKRGHEVVVVTMRYPTEAITVPCDVVYTSRKAKMGAVAEKVDIWVDDNPHWIFQDSA